ncbi:MAG TPA: OmpA family protein [Opitutaceae bacterium]|nr:OmpA family protein [Opitutaceae bacterium]
MKLASKSLCIVAASAALLAGCRKKPIRPNPSETALGPQTGGTGLTPTEIPTTADTTSTLEARPPGYIEDKDTIRGLLQPVYFDFDRDNVRPAERAKLQAAKEYLDKHPEQRLLLEGHCDWRGTAEYNLGLGDRRASRTKKYLSSIGVGADKLETLSKGSEEAKKNADEETMSHDRRVELVILKKS